MRKESEVMSSWHTVLVECFSVYCSQGPECPKEFSDFDEAAAFMEQMRDKYPDAAVQLSALLDA